METNDVDGRARPAFVVDLEAVKGLVSKRHGGRAIQLRATWMHRSWAVWVGVYNAAVGEFENAHTAQAESLVEACESLLRQVLA